MRRGEYLVARETLNEFVRFRTKEIIRGDDWKILQILHLVKL